MRGGTAGLVCLLALAGWPACAPAYVPESMVMLFAPGSAEVTPAARDVLLAFLRPPRPPAFRGHCIVAHADRGPGAAALSRARAEAVAATMLRQGVDRADIAMESRGDAAPARLAPAGRAEPMNDRVELNPCPGPRLAGVAAAEAAALDAAIVPPFVAALVPRIARALGCPTPEVRRTALSPPPFACPAEVPAEAVPRLAVLRMEGSHQVAVVLEWPVAPGPGPAWDRAAAAAGSVLDLFGLPSQTALAALATGPGAARRVDIEGPGMRIEIEAGPGLLRRLRLIPTTGDGP